MKTATLFLALALLTACSDDPAIPTDEENRQLDDASQMLNQASANLEAVDDGGLGSGELANAAP